jgi:hypothetical protein
MPPEEYLSWRYIAKNKIYLSDIVLLTNILCELKYYTFELKVWTGCKAGFTESLRSFVEIN